MGSEKDMKTSVKNKTGSLLYSLGISAAAMLLYLLDATEVTRRWS